MEGKNMRNKLNSSSKLSIKLDTKIRKSYGTVYGVKGCPVEIFSEDGKFIFYNTSTVSSPDVIEDAYKAVVKRFPLYTYRPLAKAVFLTRRQFYLNQYLLFFEENLRFPRDNESILDDWYWRRFPLTREFYLKKKWVDKSFQKESVI